MEEAKKLREIACRLRKLASERKPCAELDPEKVRDFLLFYGGRRDATNTGT